MKSIEGSPIKNMDALPEYHHEPLTAPDALRILVLDPAVDPSTDLQGSIIEIRRFEELLKTHHQKPYSAVSYTWGEPNLTEDLFIHGNNESAPSSRLKITHNVKSMLSHLRKAHKPRSLWIDAICLNQSDDSEKALQIPLMGEIYSQADKVHIWLGPNDGHDIGRVFSFLRLAAHLPEPVDFENISLTVFGHANLAIRPVGNFFERPWFFRRWILQEAALAKYGIVICGSYRITYPTFVEACRRLQDSVHGRNKYAIETTMALARDRNTREIFNLLWLFHKSSCHEKRDRIMALYGFIPRQKQLTLDSNTTHVSLYKKHANWLIENSREHEMLLHLFHFGPLPVQPDSAKPGLCDSSWIPDWSNQRYQPLAAGCPDSNASVLTTAYSSLLHEWYQDQPQVFQDRICSTWRRFIISPTSSYHDKSSPDWSRVVQLTNDAPCTLITSEQDEVGRSVLNVRWVNPWAGPYGRSVKQVVTMSGIPNTWKDVMGSFDILFGRNPKRKLPEDGTNRLCLLIESVMSQKDCHSLRHWEAYDRPLVVKQAIALLATGSYQEPTLLCQYVDMSKSGLSLLETLQDMILDLGIVMHQHQLAIVEIEGVQFGKNKEDGVRPIEYAIGPSSINQSTLLIPMASRLPRTETNSSPGMWYEDIGNNKLNPTSTDQWGKMSWPRAALTTLIAVQPLDLSFGNPPITAGILERNDKFVSKKGWAAIVSGFLPPVKTRYLGPCLATAMVDAVIDPTSSFIGIRDYAVLNFKNSPLNSTGWDWWDCMAETYFDVKLRGLPIPFTVDIV